MKTYEKFTQVRYSCVLLDKESQSNLKELYCIDLTADWEIYCHHMTICLGELPSKFQKKIGQEIQLKTIAIGQDDKAYAVKVQPLDPELQKYYEMGAKSGPSFPHITLAINKSNGGKPVMSNSIKEWIDIKDNEEILLTGKITEIKN